MTDAFASALKQPVSVEVAPRDQWEAVYKGLGFSDAAARSYVAMTTASLDGGFEKPDAADRGRVTLHDFLVEALAN